MESLFHTARWAAAQRARESGRPDRLFHDPVAELLAGSEGMLILQRSEQRNPQAETTAAYIAIRTRCFDDLVMRAMTNGVRQCVLVAAGMDARAFRLQVREGAAFFELDQPLVLESKEQTLSEAGVKPKCRRAAVPVDLRGDWLPALTAAGFDREQPSVWVVEGLFYYLKESEARSLMGHISEAASAGSRFGADMVSASFFTSPWTKQTLEMLAQNGMPWQFGTDDPEELLAEYGWRTAVHEPGQDGFNHGRWPHPVPKRDQRELPHSFLIESEKVV